MHSKGVLHARNCEPRLRLSRGKSEAFFIASHPAKDDTRRKTAESSWRLT
jgi:hypothetical protein